MATKKQKLGIKLLVDGAKLPQRNHPTDAGIDIYSLEDVVLNAGTTTAIRTGVAIELPKGFYARLVATSGNSLKTPLRVIEGTIDQDYRGEIKVIVDVRALEFKRDPQNGQGFVIPTQEFFVPKGSKIAQLIVTTQPSFDIEGIQDLTDTERGDKGFGSSGVIGDNIQKAISEAEEAAMGDAE